jgi:hypothetical protein
VNAHRRSRPRVARIVGLLLTALALAIADAWFVAHCLVDALRFPATGGALAAVIRETPDYLVLAVLLLAGLAASIVDLVKLVRATETLR